MFLRWMNGPLFDEMAGDGGDLAGVADVGVSDAGVSDSGSIDAGGDFDAEFAKASARARTTSNQQSTDDGSEEQTEEQPPEEQATDEATDAPEPVAEQHEDDDPDDLQPDKISGKQYFYRESKAKRLMAAADTLDRIHQVIPDATPEALQNYYESAVRTEEMVADFDSGDPNRMSKFVDFWFSNEAPPNAVQAFASQFLGRLPHAAPEVYKQFSTQANNQLIQGLYQRGLGGDENAMSLAQNLDFALRGKFFDKTDFQQRDPYAEERARFEKERNQFNQERQQEAKRRLEERALSVDNQVGTARTQAIEEALKPIEKQFRDKPQWKHMVRDLTEQVEQAIQSDAVWQKRFAMARDRAVSDPSGKLAEQLTAMVRQYINPIIARGRKAVIQSATGTVMKASEAAHEAGQKTAARREPASPAGAAQRLTHEQKLREVGQKDGFDAAFRLSAQRAREVSRSRSR